MQILDVWQINVGTTAHCFFGEEDGVHEELRRLEALDLSCNLATRIQRRRR